MLDDGLDALLDEYDALDRGFKRKERLDVKKPGPFFSTNNYAFQHTPASEEHDIKQVSVMQSDSRNCIMKEYTSYKENIPLFSDL